MSYDIGYFGMPTFLLLKGLDYVEYFSKHLHATLFLFYQNVA